MWDKVGCNSWVKRTCILSWIQIEIWLKEPSSISILLITRFIHVTLIPFLHKDICWTIFVPPFRMGHLWRSGGFSLRSKWCLQDGSWVRPSNNKQDESHVETASVLTKKDHLKAHQLLPVHLPQIDVNNRVFTINFFLWWNKFPLFMIVLRWFLCRWKKLTLTLSHVNMSLSKWK